MTRKNALFILNNTVMFRVVERSESDLPEDIRRLNGRAKRGIYDRFRIAIERGIQSGHFRPVDPSVAAFSIIGLCSWTAWRSEEHTSEIQSLMRHSYTVFCLEKKKKTVSD